jgi:hypothetical protein
MEAGGTTNTRVRAGCRERIVKLRVGTVNVGTLKGRGDEVVEMAGRRRLDFCCLQETRWRGASSVKRGKEGMRYRIYYQGCEEGVAGVGIMVHEKWFANVLETRRISERILVLRVRIGSRVLCVVSVYAPQAGRPEEEKVEFYCTLRNVLRGIRSDEKLLLCGDFNGHVGVDADGFDGVHGGNGFGRRNSEGEVLLEFADSMGMVIANTWFRKSDLQKITYESGGCRTVVDYVLVRKCERASVKDVKVIRSEACVPQHKLMVCVIELQGRVGSGKKQYVSRCKIWRLREESSQRTFTEKLQQRAAERTGGESLESLWKGLKDGLLEISDQVCGRSKGPPRHKETWWWNKETEIAVKEKRRLYVVWDASRSDQDRQAYCKARSVAKKEIHKAKEVETQKLGERLEKEDGKGNLFRIAKQMVKGNRDVVGGGCVKDKDGKMVVDDPKVLEVWKDYYEKLLNVEFDWNRNDLDVVDAVSGPSECLSKGEVMAAIAKSKSGKAAGPSGLVAEMLKASGEVGGQWVTDICNKVVVEGRIPEDWRSSLMVNVYKGKGDALECGSYRGIKLLDQVMKVLERVVEARIRERVKVDGMQFGFTPKKGTMDAIFIVRQVQEQFLAKQKVLWMAFVDLEKAFDRVPREVLWWALRYVKVEEWIIDVIKAMYVGATTAVKLPCGVSEQFEVKVGVHQGSVLSPLLFVIVMEALASHFKEGLPWEILYADDLVLLAETEEELRTLIERWRYGIEVKGLRVNMGKTKVMKCEVSAGQAVSSGAYPCGVCKAGVGQNSIACTGCKKWIHHRCSGISGQLKTINASSYICPKCVGGAVESGEGQSVFKLSGCVDLEIVGKFCYLGDMVGKGGGAGEASRCRASCAWSKFNELAPWLTARGPSLRVKGRIYRIFVQRAMVYGSETWAMKVDDLRNLQKAENAMVRQMCRKTLRNRVRNVEMRGWLGIESVEEMVKRGRLGWYGHVERKERDDWVSACRELGVVGTKKQGRGRKRWIECVNVDMSERGLCKEDVHKCENTVEWNRWCRGDRPTPPVGGRGGTDRYDLRTLRR